MADTSIYGRLKTLSDYAAERQAYRANEQAAALRDLQMMAGQHDMAAKQRAQMDAERLMQFTRSIPGDATDDQMIRAYRSQGYLPQAAEFEKSALERQKAKAEVSYKNAQADREKGQMANDVAGANKTRAEAIGAAIKNYRMALESIADPQGASQWLAAQYQDPVLGPFMQRMAPIEQAMQRIPQDPQGFQQWRVQAAMGMEKQMEAAAKAAEAQLRAKTEARNAANDTLIQDASGKWVPNQPLIAAKERVARAGASTINVGDKVPTPVVKQQDDLIDKISTATAIDADLSAIEARIKAGELNFGPLRNLINQGKNLAGASDPESRNLATFQSTLEKLRNDSLRLNSGVQTEGDAQRAWNELFQNINDTELVKQRMAEIRKINQRAAQLQKYRLDVLRKNFGAGPLEPPAIEPALQGPASGGVDDLVNKYRSKPGNGNTR